MGGYFSLPRPSYFLYRLIWILLLLSYRREIAQHGGLVLAKVHDWNWETIFYGYYRSIFNHCDIIGLQTYQIQLKTQNKSYYAVQCHPRSSKSVPIESPYATSY